MTLSQRGLTTVEFAVVGAVAILVLIGVIEIARMLFVWNTIGEVTRRGARLAVVCPVGDAAIVAEALMNRSGGDPVLNGLTAANVDVSYRDAAGAPTAVFDLIEYVRVEITGYAHTLLIPFVPLGPVTLPAFSTTLPIESLGLIPEDDTFICMDSPE